LNPKWDRRFLELARHVAAWSKDPSTQVGAVVAEGKRVVSLGYNGSSLPDVTSRGVRFTHTPSRRAPSAPHS
jgi:deoxycytidylate deaminase